MHTPTRWIGSATLVLGLTLGGALGAAAAPPQEMEMGEDEGTAAWARGPIAMTNGLTLPVRGFFGSFLDGTEPVLMSPLSLGWGTVKGVQLVGVGALETVSFGAFELVPDEATTLDTEFPILLPFHEEQFGTPSDPPRSAYGEGQ